MINRWEPPTKSSTGRRIGISLCCSLLLIMALLLPCSTGFAHDLGLSGITIHLENHTARVTVVTPISRLMRAEGSTGEIAPFTCDIAIRRRLKLLINGVPFVPTAAEEAPDTGADMLRWSAAVQVPDSMAELRAESRLYPEDPGTRTLLIVEQAGKPARRVMLDAGHPRFDTAAMGSIGPIQTAQRFIVMGASHIFTGADHMLFVAALLLTAASLRGVLKTITAFTVAHTITLCLTAVSAIAPSARIIEPLIALSICVTAAENLRILQKRNAAEKDAPEGRDLRTVCAFGFGLVHGCGFAGGLTEVGLKRAALALPLASFNIGVELGQCVVVAAVLPLLLWLGKRSPTAQRGMAAACSCVIGFVGAYWCFARMHGV